MSYTFEENIKNKKDSLYPILAKLERKLFYKSVISKKKDLT